MDESPQPKAMLALEALPDVAAGLASDQILKAQQLAREFKPSKPSDEGGLDSR